MTAPVDSYDFLLQLADSNLATAAATIAAAALASYSTVMFTELKHRRDAHQASAVEALDRFNALVDAMRPRRSAGKIDRKVGYIEQDQLVVDAARAAALMRDRRAGTLCENALNYARAYYNLGRVGLFPKGHDIYGVQHLLVQASQRILRAVVRGERLPKADAEFITRRGEEVARLRLERDRLDEERGEAE